jgi:SAM-dependent MidA family methyltransferase
MCIMGEANNIWQKPSTPREIEPNLLVEDNLRTAILAGGPITFAAFMEICLHQEGGYYNNSDHAQIDVYGSPADFITAPEAHPAFGATIANVFHDMWKSMNKPESFDIIEGGAGNGTFARDVLQKMRRDYNPMCRSMRYGIIEKSPTLIKKQQQRLGSESVGWVLGDVTQMPVHGIRGVYFSNEQPDTNPVHVFVSGQEDIAEVYVDIDENGEFVPRKGKPSIQIPPYLLSIDRQPGEEFTVCPATDKWYKNTVKAIDEGYIFTIDYGAAAMSQEEGLWKPRVYSANFKERTGLPVEYAYRYPGTGDITTSVNFDYLKRYGEELGLITITHTTQADFLLRNGFSEELDRIIQADQTSGSGIEPMTHYFSSYPITSPDEMGNFEVLIQQKIKVS